MYFAPLKLSNTEPSYFLIGMKYFSCCFQISPFPSVWLTSRENTWFVSVTSAVFVCDFTTDGRQSHMWPSPMLKTAARPRRPTPARRVMAMWWNTSLSFGCRVRLSSKNSGCLLNSTGAERRHKLPLSLNMHMSIHRHTFGLYKSVVCWGVTVWRGAKVSRSTQTLLMPSDAPSYFIKLSADRVDASGAANLHPTTCARWSWFFAVLPKKWGWKISMNHASSQQKTRCIHCTQLLDSVV